MLFEQIEKEIKDSLGMRTFCELNLSQQERGINGWWSSHTHKSYASELQQVFLRTHVSWCLFVSGPYKLGIQLGAVSWCFIFLLPLEILSDP